MSAIVKIRNKAGALINARALLDTCATSHLITKDLAKKLKLPVERCSVQVGAVNSLQTLTTGSIDICIKSLYNNKFEKSLSCLIISKIADFEPSETFPRNNLNIPSNLPLADPQFHVPKQVDLLIGCGATVSLIQSGQIKLSQDGSDLFMQKTRLGWVIVGGLNGNSKSRVVSCHLTELLGQIDRFLTSDVVGTDSVEASENSLCEQQYAQTFTRLPNGRYVVRLPFRTNKVELGDSRMQAFRRFLSLDKKLKSNPELRLQYHKVMQEWIELGHMTLIFDESLPGYYIPHHAVIKIMSITTQLRVVFDASAKSSNGLALNDVLMIGPTIQDKLFVHLLRFRSHVYAITGDIEKMYRQVVVHPDDRRYQRVFWYHEGQIRVFNLNTVTFGVSSAPFLAIRTLHQLADDEAHNFPRASEILKRDMYVDDLLTGAETLEEVVEIRNELIQLLKRGQINIRKWASNHQHALDNVDEKVLGSDVVTSPSAISKTLGVVWNSLTDSLVYTSKSIELDVKFTKRNILSEIAKIFDPLGLLGPVVFCAKIIMQQCWKLKIGWDESITEELSSKWTAFAQQLGSMQEVSIDRRYLIDKPSRIEIHGFCDASKSGYGACIYIRSIDSSGNILVRLACSKSRVAPIKTETTIPRLELCGALTLARLYNEARIAFNFPITRCIFRSDSTIVLQWLQKPPEVLNVFEANRVREIQALGNDIEWQHVRTEDNPADAISRGQFPAEFARNQTWFTGPSWLSKDERYWPVSVGPSVSKLPGLKKSACFLAKPIECEIFRRFSSYSTLVSCIAFCLRLHPKNPFHTSRLNVEEGLPLISIKRGLPSEKKVIPLSIEDRLEAERKILRLIQREQFSVEIDALAKSKEIKSPKIAALNPYLDGHGLLRVGGRLKNADIPDDQRCPILLPSRHHVTDLIIRETHKRTHHAGIQGTLFAIRHRFWLLDGKGQVRHIVHHCVTCIRYRPVPIQYKMADLPTSRVQGSTPFQHTGVDYFGPIYVKEKKYRNRKSVKVYGCIFIDLATKFVHIEVVADMSTAEFFGAVSRFIGRRGTPSHIYSDRGLNFVGASNQLRELYDLLSSNQLQTEINAFAVENKINWHFNPPASPHFGGIWEAAVKSFKHHLRRVIGTRLLTVQELNTLAIEIEAILNSRPLCSISTDPNDPIALTPADIVVGRKLTMLPEDNLLSVPENHLSSWRYITRVRQDFWKRWRLEYLSELQKRQMWHGNKGGDIKKGSVVILMDKNTPCMVWELGVILEVCPGSDGVKRVVKVKTSKGVYTRNTTTLCPLPIE